MENTVKGYYLENSWNAAEAIDNICINYGAKIIKLTFESSIYVELEIAKKYAAKAENILAAYV